MPPNIKFQDADYWSEVSHKVTFLSKPEEQGPKTPVDEQEETIGQRLWNKRKECPEDEDIFAVIDDEVKKCWEALKSIKILHNKESCQEWLTEFGGTLYDVPLEVLEADDIQLRPNLQLRLRISMTICFIRCKPVRVLAI